VGALVGLTCIPHPSPFPPCQVYIKQGRRLTGARAYSQHRRDTQGGGAGAGAAAGGGGKRKRGGGRKGGRGKRRKR
jgi:hypothetical protein